MHGLENGIYILFTAHCHGWTHAPSTVCTAICRSPPLLAPQTVLCQWCLYCCCSGHKPISLFQASHPTFQNILWPSPQVISRIWPLLPIAGTPTQIPAILIIRVAFASLFPPKTYFQPRNKCQVFKNSPLASALPQRKYYQLPKDQYDLPTSHPSSCLNVAARLPGVTALALAPALAGGGLCTCFPLPECSVSPMNMGLCIQDFSCWFQCPRPPPPT